MFKHQTIWLPITLSLAISGCSTTQQEQDQQQLVTTPVVDAVEADTNEGEVQLLKDENSDLNAQNSNLNAQNSDLNAQNSDLNAQNSQLRAELADKNAELAALQSRFSQNTTQLELLNNRLNEKDRIIVKLLSESAQAQSLQTLESERTERDDLETKYNQLVLENDQLKQKIVTLQSQKQQLEMQLSQANNSFVCEPSNISEPVSQKQSVVVCPPVESTSEPLQAKTADQDLDALNQQHVTLIGRYDQLEQDHQALTQKHNALLKTNSDLNISYAKLKQENLDLGGAIADARAQHQVLWERIATQDKRIIELENERNQLQSRASLVSTPETTAIKANSTAADNTNAAPEVANLEATIVALENRISEQQSQLRAYQNQMAELEASQLQERNDSQQAAALMAQSLAELQIAFDDLTNENNQMTAALAAVNENLRNSQNAEAQLAADLEQMQSQRDAVRKELTAINTRLAQSQQEKQQLENQINLLIPFEAEVNALEQQLQTNVTNLVWQRPVAMPLNNAFEIVVTADVTDALTGQVFVAELLPDSSFELISASEVEALVEDDKLQWRWRVSGLSEQQEARVDLFVHQQIQYRDQRFSRQVYRDQTLVSLTNDNWFEKYGFWSIAIIFGLLAGFIGGRIGKEKK